MKAQKGITLVALVITIIVLLILAMVSISIVANNNIMERANTAGTKHNEAAQNELNELNYVNGLMDKYLPEP